MLSEVFLFWDEFLQPADTFFGEFFWTNMYLQCNFTKFYFSPIFEPHKIGGKKMSILSYF